MLPDTQRILVFLKYFNLWKWTQKIETFNQKKLRTCILSEYKLLLIILLRSRIVGLLRDSCLSLRYGWGDSCLSLRYSWGDSRLSLRYIWGDSCLSLRYGWSYSANNGTVSRYSWGSDAWQSSLPPLQHTNSTCEQCGFKLHEHTQETLTRISHTFRQHLLQHNTRMSMWRRLGWTVTLMKDTVAQTKGNFEGKIQTTFLKNQDWLAEIRKG